MHRRHFLCTLGLGLLAPPFSFASTRGKTALEPVKQMPPIPSFDLADLEGKIHCPEQYLGKVLLINFWATWCPPCLAEMNSIARLHALRKGRPFDVLAIAMQQSAEQVQTYAASNPLPFPLLPDPKGQVATAFGVEGLPTTYLTNRSGQLIFRAQGGRQWDSDYMQRAIELLLA